jgi:hypothetical protein
MLVPISQPGKLHGARTCQVEEIPGATHYACSPTPIVAFHKAPKEKSIHLVRRAPHLNHRQEWDLKVSAQKTK